jgi:hypothetical protein
MRGGVDFAERDYELLSILLQKLYALGGSTVSEEFS